MPDSFIRHTVVFSLKHPAESVLVDAFLRDATRILSAIPTVSRFECLRQVSGKNRFQFGFSMEFADQAGYELYNVHPAHSAFVAERWIPEVADFMEIDYVPHRAESTEAGGQRSR